MLGSCAPVNNISNQIKKNISNNQDDASKEKPITKKIINKKEGISDKNRFNINFNNKIQNSITIILSKKDDNSVVEQFVNTIELAVYKKNLQNISFDISFYENREELNLILKNANLPGKIFIGPLNTQDTKLLQQYCEDGVVFFSFSPSSELAKNCVYLVNFFPANEIRTIFNHFPNNSKVALLYPENSYGFGINKIIDQIANKSDSVIVNRASYKENLSNAAEAIKELGRYELRKYELNRQKKILANKKDQDSKKRLIKLEKFQTTKDLDFTHVIIDDYGLRLLQVAPLLPYYDIDPNLIMFVGTGAWDDKVFYDEPSLSGAIYPGIEAIKRRQLADDFYNLYNEKIQRISTLPYDLVGLLSFIINKKYTIKELYKLLNESNIKFSGIDGSFYFLNNIIERDLDILKIKDGRASKVLK